MMESAPPASETLYSGDVPMLLKHPDREDRHGTLTVEMSYGVTQPRNQRVLHVQLTDEADAYLLYTLDISEDEFHSLKTEQSLLVDFQTFPSKLVELLRQCQASASDEHPRFVAVLATGGGGGGGSSLTGGGMGGAGFGSAQHGGLLGALAAPGHGTLGGGAPTLTVTETNPFRQLCHLSLRLVAGNDHAIKTYLAEKLSDFKAELAATRDDLSLRTRQLNETAEHAAVTAERLRTADEAHSREVAALQARHANLTAEAREAAVSAQQSLSRQAEADRLRLIERHEAEASGLRSAAHEADQTAAALTARLHQTELSLREATNRNEALDQEVRLLRRQTAELRADNSELAASNHALEKAAGASRVELAALAASVTDKEALVAKSASLLEAANDARRALEETLVTHKENNARLQSKLKISAAEIIKGNQIIGKLQADVRSAKSKLKLKASELVQQAEAVARKQQAVDAADRQMAELRAQLTIAASDKAKADEGAAECKRQLSEAQELLRSNQQVIQWLNKELNDTQAGTRAHSAAALLAAAKGSAFRPSFPRPGSVERPPSMAACDAAAASSSPPLASGGGNPAGFRSELRSKAALAALGESAGGDASAQVVRFNEYLAPSISTSC